MTVTINGTTGITSPGGDVSTSLATGALTVAGNNISAVNGFQRNRIINGDMRIDQRNAGASVTGATSDPYIVDRWKTPATQNSKFTFQQNAGAVTPPSGFTNYLGATSSSAYSLLSTDYFTIQQLVEGFNAADLAWGTAGASAITLSFWVRSSLTGTFGGAITNSAQNRSYQFSYTISAANTWEYKTVTIPGDTTGTWLTTNGIGMRVSFSLGAGTSYSGAAGSWSASNLYGVTGQQQVVATNGATFYITGVQLEAGSVATPFERRPYGTELALCQRYFSKSIPIGLAVGDNPTGADDRGAIGVSYLGGSIQTNTLQFPVTMRTTPTLTLYRTSASPTNGTWALFNGSSWIALTGVGSSSNDSKFQIAWSGGAGTSNAGAYLLSGYWVASAEL